MSTWVTKKRLHAHVDAFLLEHEPSYRRRVRDLTPSQKGSPCPKWGTIHKGITPSITIHESWLGPFDSFDASIGEEYLSPLDRTFKSFSGPVRMNAVDIFFLARRLDKLNLKISLVPRVVNVDYAGSRFPWLVTEQECPTETVGRLLLFKGDGKGGGIRVYNGSVVYDVEVLNCESERHQGCRMRWLFIPRTASYRPKDLDEGWFSTVVIDVVSLYYGPPGPLDVWTGPPDDVAVQTGPQTS